VASGTVNRGGCLAGVDLAGVVDGPVSNASVAIAFRQSIGATDALRTGAYAKTRSATTPRRN
jgi:hypothetical protein